MPSISSSPQEEVGQSHLSRLAERLPGELGRYRRYLAAKALAGAFAPPAASSVKEAALDSLRAGANTGAYEGDDAVEGDGDEVEEAWEEARPAGEFDYEQCAGALRAFNRWYVRRAIALNTVVIDHLRSEYSAWVDLLRRGHVGMCGAYGRDYMSHFMGGRERVRDEQLFGTFYPADGSVAVAMSLVDFDRGCKSDEMLPGRFVRIVGGETLVRMHGTSAGRYEAQTGKRTSAKAAEELERGEGSFRYARLEQERELGELVERRIERGFENLAEPDEEERALLLDGGRERMVRLMREASAVGARAWFLPDGCGAARAARAHDAETDGAAMDVAAVPLQATQGYGASQEDDDVEAEADEEVRRAPTWHATQQYGWPQDDDEGRDDDDEAVRRPGWSDAQMAESPRALAARWAACGLEMDDELTGEPSRTTEEAECMSDVHDELLSSMDAVAVGHAQDAEGEQQSERVSVECVGCVDDGAGGVSREARRGHEGEQGGAEGCEGVDGVEQGASTAAREAEGDDEDEVMVGAENISMQRAEGGGGTTGGIKKKRPKKRAKGEKSHTQRQLAARPGLAREA